MNLQTWMSLNCARKLDGRVNFQGLDISIENAVGSVRSGKDPNGKPWSVKMTHAYGYVRMSKGVDGDHVDCFLGPNNLASNAFVIHTKKSPEFKEFDEDKCMLGFSGAEAAKKAFLANYSDPRFFGSMDVLPMSDFKKKVLATKDQPAKIAANLAIMQPANFGTVSLVPNSKPPSLKDQLKVTQEQDQIDDAIAQRLRVQNPPRKNPNEKDNPIPTLPWSPGSSTAGLAAGGPGSGCNPEVAEPRCGRPSKDGGKEGRDERDPGEIFLEKISGLKSPTRPLSAGESTEDAWKTGPNGTWNPERAAYHDALVDRIIKGHTPPVGRGPEATILGGGTASGKTTASRVIIGDDPNVLRVDPDEIKLAIPEYDGLKKTDQDNAAFRVHEESSYVTKLLMARARALGLDLTYDSTTSGNGGVDMSTKLLNQGYKVDVLFVDIPLATAIARAKKRAEESDDIINKGRKVKEGIIVSSHVGAAKNFFALKDLPGLRKVRFYNNDVPRGSPARLVYERENGGKEHVHDAAKLEQYKKKSVGVAEIAAFGAPRNGLRPIQIQGGRGGNGADVRSREEKIRQTYQPSMTLWEYTLSRRRRNL